MADEFTAEHPNVTINITVLENDAFKPKLTTEIQGGNVPDLFQSWGGGGMAEQVDAGLLKDITADVADWKDTINPGALGMYQLDGKQYGIPFDLGMVGFWYNKDQFTQAGITTPPATWDEFLAAVDKLKDAGITPIAVGGSPATWTEMFWWAYLAVRTVRRRDHAAGCRDRRLECAVLRRGRHEAQRARRQGAVPGGLPRRDVGRRRRPGRDDGRRQGRDDARWASGPRARWPANTADEQPVTFDLGWFPFPAVDGGAGRPTDGFGGGNGFAVGKDAPPEAVEFLKYISTDDNAEAMGRPEHRHPAGDRRRRGVRDRSAT